MKNKFLISIFSLLLFYGLSFSQTEIPIIKQRVTDMAGFLSSSEVQALEKMLKDYEDTTSTQIVIITLAALDGYEIEEFAAETIKQNGIGQKNKNNGLLILAIKDSRKVRIEVGYGLEPVVTDAVSGQIVRNDIAPNFKKSLYYQGFSMAIVDLQKAIGGEFILEKKDKSVGNNIPSFIWVIVFVILAIISGLNRKRRVGGWTYFGGGLSTGGSRSSGSSGFGGFSGGGGMSGGGGASGSW